MQELENSHPTQPTSTNGTKKENVKAIPTKASPLKKKEATKTTPKKWKAEVISSEDELVDPKPAPKIEKSTRSTPKKAKPSEPSPAQKEAAAAATPPPPPPPKKTPTKPAPKPAPKSATKSTKKGDVDEIEGDLERKAILESIETVDLPDVDPPSDKKYSLSYLELY
jgi:hypothetical protein